MKVFAAAALLAAVTYADAIADANKAACDLFKQAGTEDTAECKQVCGGAIDLTMGAAVVAAAAALAF